MQTDLIHQFLENSANIYPEKVAVIHDDDRVSYSQLNNWANSLANHLREKGIKTGDRIALLLENSVDYIFAYYGILKAGAIAVPLNPGLKPDGLQYLLNDSEPAAIIATSKSERLLKATNLDIPSLKLLLIRNPKQSWNNHSLDVSNIDEFITGQTDQTNLLGLSGNELASIIYTSGSTGKPKGVMLSHGNIVSNTNSICQYLEITHTDIQMVVLPFFYVFGKSLLNTHIAAGGTVILNNRFLYPADVLNQMINEKVTGFSGVPSTYAYLLNRSPLESSRDKLNSLRYCSQAGGHMAMLIKQALRKALPEHTKIFIMYGATEASARLTYLTPEFFETKPESIGQPIPGVTIRILDNAMQEVPDGIEGELVAAGPNIMQGYWNNPKDTERALNGGCYLTGDIGYRDADGFLHVLRRKDGLLKVSGHRINPIDIEDFLISTGLLIETAVIGIPDELQGNKLIALVVPKKDNFNPQFLLETCTAGLPKYKIPSALLVVRTLPKNASGKIDREKCLELSSKLDPTN